MNMKQHYMIAGLKVEMDSFGKTVTQAEPYRCEPFDSADIVIDVSWERVKEKAPHMTKDVCEYMATGGFFYLNLLNFDGMMIHASAVMMDGGAYLFTAPCGTGKSTHTQLWRKRFGDRAQILNDDKPALRLEDGRWYAYGTPWSGKYDYSVNTKVPLAGICILSRGDDNRILPYGGAKAIHDILTQTIRSSDADAMIKLLELLDQLVTAVPVWKMECTPDPEAARVAYRAMSGKEE
jgi:hypothetical protein